MLNRINNKIRRILDLIFSFFHVTRVISSNEIVLQIKYTEAFLLSFHATSATHCNNHDHIIHDSSHTIIQYSSFVFFSQKKLMIFLSILVRWLMVIVVAKLIKFSE